MTTYSYFPRVKGYVDHFHDVQDIKMDHIALARYVNKLGIHILVEWDGMYYSSFDFLFVEFELMHSFRGII